MTFFDADAASRMVFSSSHDPGDLGYHRDVIASRASDDQLAEAGQGGATVTALMLMMLERGVIDAAALTARPPGEVFSSGTVASTPDEIRSCAGSKFVGSHTLSAVRAALDRGFQRIGVVGVPCQVRSLRKMALYDLREEGLRDRIAFVVGLFCNWAFSAREFVAFLVERFAIEEIRRFQIPPPPADCLEVQTRDGLRSIPLADLRPLIQAACNTCGDMTAEFADLSVGMFEGRDGWNTLVVRSDKGLSVLDEALAAGVIKTEPFPAENLVHLKCASANKRKRLPEGR
jgi:coenzyme F420 hydrogenase subunit beta